MTEIVETAPDASIHTSSAARTRLGRRYAAERRFQIYGLAAIGLAGLFLTLLMWSVIKGGLPAFVQHTLTIEIMLDEQEIAPDGERDPLTIAKANFNAIIGEAIRAQFPHVSGRSDRRTLARLVSSGAPYLVQREVTANPDLIGGAHTFSVPLSDTADLYLKGEITDRIEFVGRGVAMPIVTEGIAKILSTANDFSPLLAAIKQDHTGDAARLTAELPSFLVHINGGVVKVDTAAESEIEGEVLIPLLSTARSEPGAWKIVEFTTAENARKFSDKEIVWTDALVAAGGVVGGFNTGFFTTGASREPELAGIWGAVVGSFYTMLVTLVMSFPLGVAAAVYLEEFAAKNRWTDLIEVNINNLAAVPSIVFGLLGLAVFLGFFGLPRSAPLVGGMVLALMTLPTIIIAARAALRAVPPSIREAAMAIGASRIQTVSHHVLPLAMPGILTGTIIGMAQALGEAAPLLMIGMVAFIVDIPGGLTDPATVLPVQIYMWADFPERAFTQKTSAAIMVLLGFLITMNALAVLLRRRFERRW